MDIPDHPDSLFFHCPVCKYPMTFVEDDEQEKNKQR